jgi:hypothetical protein
MSDECDPPPTAEIVELSWGRASQAMVYEYADDGKLTGVTLVRSLEEPDPERRRLCCTRDIWYAVLALGRRYQWLPMGSAPAPGSQQAWDARGWFDNGYDPDTRVYAKQLLPADTAELADALERALDDPAAAELMRLMSIMTGVTAGSGEAGPPAVHGCLSPANLRDLITFLRQGPLVFAWADLPGRSADE